MTETFIVQSETLREPGVSLCTGAFFCFNGQNYLFNLSTIELSKRNSELSIVNEFPRNDTLASRKKRHKHIPFHQRLGNKHKIDYCIMEFFKSGWFKILKFKEPKPRFHGKFILPNSSA